MGINLWHNYKLLDIRTRTPWIPPDHTLNPRLTPRPYQQRLADAWAAWRLGVFTAQHLKVGQQNYVSPALLSKMRTEPTPTSPSATTSVIRHKSAYTTELIAQILALRFSIDCQSAIDAQKRMSAKGRALLQLNPSAQSQRLTHVPAHPELVKAAAEYTTKGTGIFLADMLTSGQLADANMHFNE